MIGKLLVLLFAVSLHKCAEVIVDANLGDDEACVSDQTTPCKTFEQALTIEGVTLIHYGNQTATVKINPISVQNLDELTIVTDGSITYPFSQNDNNTQVLLSFSNVASLTLTTLTFAAKSQGSIKVSGSTSFVVQGCSFDAATQNASIGIISPFVYIRNVETVTFDQFTPESEEEDSVENNFSNFKAVGAAGIDVDDVTTFTLGHAIMTNLQGSCGVGVRVGSNVTTLAFTASTFSSITTRNNTEIGNGGGVLLYPASSAIENPTCTFTGCTFSICEALPGEGGAIYAERSITIDTCTFDRPNTYSTATLVVVDGSSTVSSDETGAISAVDVAIINSTFNGENRLNAPHESERANRDYVKEGLLHLIQCNSLTITGAENYLSYFMNTNSQIDNGAIWCESVVTIDIRDTMFNHTRGKNTGGSCLLSKPFNGSALPLPTITVTNVVANGSVTADRDNAAYGQMFNILSCISLTVTNSQFLMHNAFNAGGAIYVATCSDQISITDSSFRQTNSSSGGAIYIGESVVKATIRNVSISSCAVTGNGGGISIEATSKSTGMEVSISNVTIEKCTAICGAGININEKGSASVSYATVSIQDCVFNKNTATEVGGAIAVQRTSSSQATNTRSNQESAPFVISNSNFTENVCQSVDYSGGTYAFTNEPCGGAIAARSGRALSSASNADGVVVEVSGCNFFNSTNGAVATENSMTMQITDSNFVDNYALLSTIKQPFNAGCQNSKLFIYPKQDNFNLLCDDTCNSSMPSDAAQCYLPTPTNIAVNVTSMKVRVYPRMNPVSFSGKNLFPYKPILAVSLNNTAPAPLATSMVRKIRSNTQVYADDEVKYVYASLTTNTPETADDIQLVLDHTINLGDLKETYPPRIYLFVTTDGGRTWNDNAQAMTIRFDPKGVEDEDDGMGAGSIVAIILGVLAFFGVILMVVYEILRRRNLKSSSQQNYGSDPASRNLLAENERGTPHYSA